MKRFAYALILVACIPFSAFANDRPPPTLTLTGHGEVNAAPDQASIFLAVVTQRKNAADALLQNSKDMTDAIAAIKAAGIDAKDIQTSNLTITPQYAQAQNILQGILPKIAAYEARNMITVTIKDLNKLGTLLDRVVTLGINSINGPAFGLQEKDKVQNEARLKAMQDVKQRAALYEKGLGIKLGRMLQVSESSYMPQPAYRDMSAMMEARGPSAPTQAPVEAGELKVTAQVTVAWEILPN